MGTPLRIPVEPNILISTPGMHDMAAGIMEELQKVDAPVGHMEADLVRFSNGELKPHLPETVRGANVFLLCALQEPDPNSAIMAMLLTADALKRASAASITLVLPYLPYLRQDRKDEPRVPISARLLADLIETNQKVERVITLDMHADQEQGFFSIPVDNINGRKTHAAYFRDRFNNDFSDVVVVAPDFGSSVRAQRFLRDLGGGGFAIIEKVRTGPNKARALNFIGSSVSGKVVIIYDDMIDTGGTNRTAVKTLLEHGATEVLTCVTHGIFSGDALTEFKAFGRPVIATMTIPRPPLFVDGHASWLTYLSIDALLAQAILEASTIGGSISKLSA